ncbi:conjugal transfer protein TrbF [Acetobacter persici]|uniref:Conjugal transfer protein TrbF n=1 Tax=Acetobacter malorum TaxID=178901 RepID=A0A1Y3G9H6_9PROT|nr:conjugal transfer protein TrbF [Acetobacter malorum]OUJ06363.1 conjugal transfer protein TrbF [Acetobacter malorum]
MFRRSTTRYGTTPEPVTPYQKAAQIWDERIGSARIQARNWRLMAFGSLFLSAGLGVGLVWQSARGTITPWVVQVDRLGEAQVVAPATAGYMPTDPQIAWYLAQFVHDVRALSSDPVVVRQNWLRSYDFTTTSGAQALNDYARQNDPFARIGHEQVELDVSSVIRASPASFRIAWVERHFRDGAFTGTERWTAIVSVVLRTPRDADHLRRNPLGIFVSAINWSKELGQ